MVETINLLSPKHHIWTPEQATFSIVCAKYPTNFVRVVPRVENWTPNNRGPVNIYLNSHHFLYISWGSFLNYHLSVPKL